MEKEFTIRITTEEHPACWGKDCEGQHFVKYLIIKTKNRTNLFREGHPIYNALFQFAKDFPEIIKDMHTIKVEAMSGIERYSISRMINELEKEMSKTNPPSINN